MSSELLGHLDFPHAQQVFRIERTRAKLDGSDASCEVSFGVTSTTPDRTDAAALLGLVRGHWAVENKLHYVRDVTFDEDRSQVGARSVAHMMASLRNLAISVLRRAGAENIAAATRHCDRHVAKVLRLLGL